MWCVKAGSMVRCMPTLDVSGWLKTICFIAQLSDAGCYES